MNIQQLELPLWSQLQSARLAPETVDLVAVLDQAESAISQLPKSQQMQAAGEAILQLAQLCSLRSEVLIENWENAYRDPVVANGFFSDIVRQSMAVDLSDLIEPAPPRAHRRSKSNSNPDSVAAPVDKSAVLAMVEQLEAKSPYPCPTRKTNNLRWHLLMMKIFLLGRGRSLIGCSRAIVRQFLYYSYNKH